MAKVESGQANERGASGPKGIFRVQFEGFGDEVIQGRDGRPDAVKVRFMTEKDEPIFLGVPLSPVARNKLAPFAVVPERLPSSREGMQSMIAKLLGAGDQSWYAEAWNGWVTGIDPRDFDSMAKVWCEPGVHRGHLARVHKFTRADGMQRTGFEMLSRADRFASFTTPWPKDLLCMEGETGDQDFIGPSTALNPGVTLWRYLILFGLKWDLFLNEMASSAALYGPGGGYFANADDISPELMRAVERHGKQMVQWNMTITTQYGLGVERTGNLHQPEIVPVMVELDDFTKETGAMLAAWDQLATIILKRQATICSPDGSITEDGRLICSTLWRPIINTFPDVTTTRGQHGPTMTFPISASKWNLGGIVGLRLVAERLAEAIGKGLDLSDVLALTPGNRVAAWALTNVPELKAIARAEEEAL